MARGFILASLEASACGTQEQAQGETLEPCPIPVNHGINTLTCPDGALNKVDGAPQDRPGGSCGPDLPPIECSVDADCTDGEAGRCDFLGEDSENPGCMCTYGCIDDTSCGDGRVCLQGDCVGATCSSGDDCESGQCGIVSWNDGCSRQTRVACRSANDECRSEADCEVEGETCMHNGKRLVCANPIGCDR